MTIVISLLTKMLELPELSIRELDVLHAALDTHRSRNFPPFIWAQTEEERHSANDVLSKAYHLSPALMKNYLRSADACDKFSPKLRAQLLRFVNEMELTYARTRTKLRIPSAMLVEHALPAA